MRDAIHLQKHRWVSKYTQEQVDSELLQSAEALNKARREKKRLAAAAAAVLNGSGEMPNLASGGAPASRVNALRSQG
jgi:hypothetical protein